MIIANACVTIIAFGVIHCSALVCVARSTEKVRVESHENAYHRDVQLTENVVGLLRELQGVFGEGRPVHMLVMDEFAIVPISTLIRVQRRVEFANGEPDDYSQAEHEKLSQTNSMGKYRLSCQCIVDRDMTVRVLDKFSESDRPDPGPHPEENITPDPQWITPSK